MGGGGVIQRNILSFTSREKETTHHRLWLKAKKKNYDLCPGNSGKYLDGIIKSKKTNLIPKSGDRVRWRTTTAYAYCHDT